MEDTPGPIGLDDLRLPQDLHKLDAAQISELADDIRRRLISSISQTGGHLSPNLGVVELTIALHRAFESGSDSIIWDVGHQAYVHKMLTGRASDFASLRKAGGISGYPSRGESSHDITENSHASTSISYAIGLATARAEADESFVVAVIGDGALTGGVAYEALNHLAQAKPERVIVVINDNGRSYAPTVGGLARHLAAVRVDPRYEATKRAIGWALREIPRIGESADEAARRVKEGLKQIVQPSTFFDVLGLKYTGPIDGHDLETLENTLAQAKKIAEPVVVHVVTEKGRGYQPAIENDADKLHGVGPFDVETGQSKSNSVTYTDVFGAALTDIASRRPDVVAVTAAMTQSTGLEAMSRLWPDRVIDVGLCEQHAVALAAGLAMGGKRPFVAIYSTFLQRALDQLMLDVALHDQPVVFIADRAGITGPDGASHHGMFDLSYLRMIPGMLIAAPADARDLCRLLETALTVDCPMAIRFPKATVESIPTGPFNPLPVGEWEELRSGERIALLAVGRMVAAATESAAWLEQRGASVGVFNARWVKPIDTRIHEIARHYDVLLTVEDNVGKGGFGAGVLETLAESGMAGKVRTLALPDQFQPHGSAEAILTQNGLDSSSIAERVIELSSLAEAGP